MKNKLFISVLVLLFSASWVLAQRAEIQYYRPWDKDGINTFEPSKKAEQPEYTGFKIRIGGSFTQDYQSITHSNVPTYKAVSGSNPANANLLYGSKVDNDSTTGKVSGFNLAMANLNLDFQIEDGIRVALENYMSSRHHNEFWVKGGYIQIDKLPMFNSPQWYTDHVRVKIGHFQPNFGDMQFRRTDGGNTIFNPFIENYIMDAFTTEIGGEAYVFVGDVMAMVGMSSGFINGNINVYPESNNNFGVVPTKKSPSIFAKLAYDKAFTEDFRFRLSGSVYNNSNSQRNTLYAGDRTGSHYFLAMEPELTNGAATSQTSSFTSGRFNPNLSNRVTAIMINPFIKFKGLELFGAYEIANGSVYGDTLSPGGRVSWEKRAFSQIAVEGIYRFLPREQMYVGLRYNKMTGEPSGMTYNQATDNKTGQAEVNIDRIAVAAGWFPSKNLLLKAEYVVQNFKDFPVADFRNEGKFNGFMVQAVIGF